ncbi:MAG: AAA family ATPase [Anaerolineae bacterium]
MNPITVADVPAPGPCSFSYDPNEFVARIREVALASQRVSTRQGKGDSRITCPLIEFYGATGQGKSWLLSHLRAEFRHDPQSDSPHPFSVLIDLGDFPDREHSSALLQALANQLGEQVGAETVPSVEERDEVAAEALGKYLHDLGRELVPVLLFDTADQADDEFLDWIEEHLIYPAIRGDAVIFVFASRTRLRWKKFEVRRRVESRELGSFERPQTGEQIEQLRGEKPDGETITALWNYSFGHPLTTRVIYDTLCHFNPDAPLDGVETWEEKLVQVVYDLIEKHFFASVKQRELRELIWNICVLRKFNVAHLREFADIEEQNALSRINELVASTLVRWSSEDGGYVFDPVVRQILARNLQMREQERYLKQHEAAAATYERWIQKYPRNAGDFLIEWMVHQTEVWRVKGESDDEIASRSATKFQRRLDQLRDDPQAQWDLPDVARALDERLLKREDMGLQTALGELQQTARSFVAQYA